VITTCCDKPNLTFGWRLGYENEKEDTLVVLLENVVCKNCDSKYTFNTLNGQACPLVAAFDDDKAVTVRVSYVRPVVM